MRLLDLGEPLLPLHPQVVEQLEALHELRAREHVHTRRRLSGAYRELRHQDLAPRERAVDRREVRDQQGQQCQTARRLEERQGRRREIGWPHEPEREHRRAAHLERALEAAHAEAVEHRGERGEDEQQPHEWQHEQPDRRVQRHDRSRPSYVRVSRASRLNTPRKPTKTARVVIAASPRGSTNVRTAESMTSTTSSTPPANHSTSSTTSTAGQLRRLTPRGQVGRRSRLRADCRRFASRRAARAALVGVVGRRGRSTRSPSATRARSRSSANSRFRACERVSDAVARTTGPSRSRSRARWRGPSDGDSATANAPPRECRRCWRAGRRGRPIDSCATRARRGRSHSWV